MIADFPIDKAKVDKVKNIFIDYCEIEQLVTLYFLYILCLRFI